MTDVDVSHDFFWHQTTALVAARCDRCYQRVATWWAQDTTTCEEHSPAEGRWSRGNCYCDPPAPLPEGDELAGYVEQARARLDRPRRQGHAPLTIRV